MTAEWDDLARLAEAATPGEWEAVGYDDMPHDVVQIGYDDQGDPWATGMIADSVHRPDAEFIAAANPATLLRLIAALDSEGTLAMVHRDLASLYREERDALAARLAAVEALADEWDRENLRRPASDGPVTAYLHECVIEVRAALAAPTDTTKETDR